MNKILPFVAVAIAASILPARAIADVMFHFQATEFTFVSGPPPPLSSLSGTLTLTDAAYLRGSASGSYNCGVSPPPCPDIATSTTNDGIASFVLSEFSFPLTFTPHDAPSFAFLNLQIDNGTLSGSIYINLNGGGTETLLMFGSNGAWSGLFGSDFEGCSCEFDGVWNLLSEPASLSLLSIGLAGLYLRRRRNS